jgi:threonine dehydratase
VIAVSSGNHAQAVALAAATVGLPALVLIPEDANPAKVAATRALGAEVIQDGITFANREQRLREEMAARGLTLVHPFDDWDVIHGQGTATLELLEDEPDLRVIAAPVGGGGLLSGTAISAKSHNEALHVVGVGRRLSKLEVGEHPEARRGTQDPGRWRADDLDRDADV